MVRYGYCCINMSLQKNEGITTNRSIKKKTFLTKGLGHVSKIAEANTAALSRILEWNNAHDIKVFRVSSALVPWASEFKWEQLPGINKIIDNLQKAGKIASEGGQRLTFHPGPFNCLGSSDERVVANSIADLRVHGDLLDMMGQPNNTTAAINIHLGGAYGSPDKAAERWCQNFIRLPSNVSSRLTLENDDKANLFSVKMLYQMVHKKVGVPIVFDSHHHECGKQDSTYAEAFDMARSSWNESIRPLCHHSNSAKMYESNKGPVTAHSRLYYKPFDAAGADVDVDLECKTKEVGLYDYLQKFEGKSAPLDILCSLDDTYSSEE